MFLKELSMEIAGVSLSFSIWAYVLAASRSHHMEQRHGFSDTYDMFMLYRANLHFHVKQGWLSEGKERWSTGRSIAYDEFIGATVRINKHCLLAAFAYYDENGTGYITVDLLEEVRWEYNIQADVGLVTSSGRWPMRMSPSQIN